MRYVTVCENLGPSLVPGADHKQKYDRMQMVEGVAWRLAADGGSDHEVVTVKGDMSKAKYRWELQWIDGRTVALFDGPDGRIYAQPTTDDPRARDRRLGGRRALRKPRRDAPGVAPEVPTTSRSEPTPEEPPARTAPARRRRKVLELLE